MSEKLGNYTNYIDSIDVGKDKIDNGINENRIKNEARRYVEKRIKEGINHTELQELLINIKQLLERQDIERINLKETLEKEIKKDTKEKLDKEKLVHEAKNTIYEKLGISDNIKSNSAIENFEKGIIDVLVVGNYDLAIEIYNTNGNVLLDALKQLASWEGIKQISESLKESVIGLFSGNAYDKGKSFAELGLVGTGAFAGLKIAKFGVKGLKHIPKNIPSENIVYNPIIKDTVKETKSKIDGIVPKQELNFEKMIVEDIAKLENPERLDAASFYLKKKLNKNQEDAIIAAHKVGKDRPGAGVNNYTQEEILQKVKILKEAGFSKEERKALLEKGICGKNVNKDLLDAEFISNRMSLTDFEKLSPNEKLEVLGIPKEFYDIVNNSGFTQQGFDIIERYKKLQYGEHFLRKKKPVDYQTMINHGLEKLGKYDIDRTDAMLLFASTDKYLFENINGVLRGTKDLTEGQKNFLNRFDQALSKMPNLEGKHIIRGDSHYSWITRDKVEFDGRRATNLEIAELIKTGKIEGFKKGDTINLDAYTYVANQKNDIFLGSNFPDKDTLIIVRGTNGGIKDISDFSMYKHFGKKLPGSGNTDVEGIIQRGTNVEFIDSRILQNATFNNGTFNRNILVVRVKNK